MKKMTVFATACLMVIAVACSKNEQNNSKGKNIKITVSVEGLNLNEQDNAHVIIAGTNTSGTASWKVNGEPRNNEAGLAISKQDLAAGNTIVIESVGPLVAANVGLTGVNFGDSFTIKYKAEVSGEVKNELSDVVTQQYQKTFVY